MQALARRPLCNFRDQADITDISDLISVMEGEYAKQLRASDEARENSRMATADADSRIAAHVDSLAPPPAEFTFREIERTVDDDELFMVINKVLTCSDLEEMKLRDAYEAVADRLGGFSTDLKRRTRAYIDSYFRNLVHGKKRPYHKKTKSECAAVSACLP